MRNYKIATVAKVKDGHAWFERMEQGIQRFSHDTGHNAFMVGPPEADEQLQRTIIENVISQAVDALCVVPLLPQALELVLGKARRQGTVVITHEASNQRNVDYDLEAFDNASYGAHLMDHLARFMDERGQYAILLGSLTSQSHKEWAKAALTRQIEKYPKMNLAARKIESHDNSTIARERTAELLCNYPDLKGILGIDMTATAGVGTTIEEQQLQDRVMVVGTGLVSVCGQHLKSGATKLISCWDPAEAGYAMNTLAVMVLNGEHLQDGMDLGVPGYDCVKKEGKVLLGSAMLDITTENMINYYF